MMGTGHLKRISSPLIAALLLASIISGGCNVGPKYKKPAARVAPAYKELPPDQFKETDGWKFARPSDDLIRGKWWEMFKDPILNSLEEQVNVSNQNIALATATFEAARALVREARAQYFPTVTTSPSVITTHFPASGGVARGAANTAANPGGGSVGAGSTGGSGTTITTYSIPFNAAWEPDLWGRVRNTVAVNAFGAQASAGDLENVRLSMHSELAVDYHQLRGLDSQKILLDNTVAAYQKDLDLVTALHQTGIDSGEDVALARTQLEVAKAQDIDVGIQRAQLEHAIAVLIGQPPSSFAISQEPLKWDPPAIPFGVPAQLLERRPDIAAAERRVAAANAQIGVARAAYYPTLSLTAAAGLQSNTLATLFNWPSRFWSVGAQLAETLFDGGLRRAVTNQSRAQYDETVATYRQTVLTAFQGVEDNLSSLRILSQERQQQDLAVQSADATVRLATERYRLGVDSYLTVIVTQFQLYTNQRVAVTLRTEQMVASVQLIMAVGGGWDSSQLPSPKDVASKH